MAANMTERSKFLSPSSSFPPDFLVKEVRDQGEPEAQGPDAPHEKAAAAGGTGEYIAHN